MIILGKEVAALEPIIKLEHLEKRLSDKFGFGPLDLEIEQGYVVAVVGPNGSGKSTLFRLLMHMMEPDHGSLRLLQRHYPEDETWIKQRIGYVSELSNYGGGHRTIRQLADFVAYWYPTWDEQRYVDLLSKFGLEPGMKLSTLSKGMQRKLSLTLALAPWPKLLLLDEPSSGLDPIAWKQMIEELMQFMKSGERTVLIATHTMDEVRRLADYIAFMYQGRLIGFHEKDALLDAWKMIWVERMPDHPSRLPGVTDTGEQPEWLITCEPEQTGLALERLGIRVVRTQALELADIFNQLVRLHTVGTKQMSSGHYMN